VSTMKREP